MIGRKLEDQVLFRRIFEASVQGILVLDEQGTILRANRALHKIFGYHTNELLLKGLETLIPNKQGKKHSVLQKKFFENPKERAMGAEHEFLGLKKDGSQLPLDISLSPTAVGGKKIVIVFVTDVSDKKKVEQALKAHERENREQLEEKVRVRAAEVTATVQKLVETNLSLEDQIQTTKAAENRAITSQALFAAIAKNFPNGLIAVFNAEMEFVYLEGEELVKNNFDKTDYEGKNIDDIPLIPEYLKEQVKKDIRKTLSGEHLSFELTYCSETFSANSIPLYADKNVTWALFVYNNISDHKQVQEELENALKIEQELNELKSRFISMASHEFRTPLSAILSSAILIGKQNEPGKEERRAKHVARIRTNVKNLVVILNDFLSLSKLEEGMASVKPEHFDLVHFANELLEELEGAKKEGQTINLHSTKQVVPVFVDPKLLNHVLINLLSNAIKYSNENQAIQFEIEIAADKVKMRIMDQGIGIPKEEQENLFERFFRAKNATNIQGTGLGLHIVKQYIELMSGTVEFTSEIGKGSSFFIQLPLNL